MGNTKSKKSQKEPDKFFDRERSKELKMEKKKKKNMNPANKRVAGKESHLPMMVSPMPASASAAHIPPPGTTAPAHVRSYDAEAVERMRYQLHNDADAFLLNNILLSVQFFENYEREVHHIKNNPISEQEQLINDAMVRRHKHVFFADRLQECVHEHVGYVRERGQTEPLTAPRLFVIYDNVEASEPGDTSDYSAVLDAPFYKLCIEDCKEPGYVKLKKLEVLESSVPKENEKTKSTHSDDSLFTDSENESNDSNDFPYAGKGQELLLQLQTKIMRSQKNYATPKGNIKVNDASSTDVSGRRRSGPIKQLSSQVLQNDISNIKALKKSNVPVVEENDSNMRSLEESDIKPRKSILKNVRRPSGPTREFKSKQFSDIVKSVSENTIAEDTESSGYRSTNSSFQNESNDTESDYGYSTIKESTTPKKLELSEPSNYSVISGVLPDECWSPVQIKAVDQWSEDEDEELDDSASKGSLSRNLYDTFYYLGSLSFMNNFVDNFIINLGSGLGLTEESVNNALTQGASIYCNTLKTGTKMSCEIFPALIAAWPNAANQWVIRERRIIQNPRTNFTYQWPTKYMVNKALGFGCLLVPVGFRPKRGQNAEQTLQWRIIFPAAERYLESCLAHSHVRCYLFALALHKTFMENEKSKIGIDASHIKNHLFWQCEDNYAKWPEDRLGETLRLFLQSFYVYFGQDRLPNYFIDNCNDFKSIPKPLLRKNQRCLADILESPVMHVLKALDKIKYTKKDFYPPLNCHRLYEILTCKNPLRILNPNLPVTTTIRHDSSDSEADDDNQTNFWDRAKNYDKHYQWKKEKQRQMQELRKAQTTLKKQKVAAQQEKQMNSNAKLPSKLEVERRRLVLEFFISHFIAMARSSERFEAIRQAVIYLEQAKRLCILLSDEPGGDQASEDYQLVVRDKLADCQRKLVNQGGFKLPRRESQLDRPLIRPLRKQRLRYENIVNQESPTDHKGISAFTFVDVHIDNSNRDIRLHDEFDEESKL